MKTKARLLRPLALSGAAVLTTLSLSTHADAASVPIAGTGYNVDGLADANTTDPMATTTHLSNTNFGLDGQYAYLETGFTGTSTSGSATTIPGIQTGSFTSLFDPNTTFAIQPAAGNNVLEITAAGSSGIVTLATPAAYSSLSFRGGGLPLRPAGPGQLPPGRLGLRAGLRGGRRPRARGCGRPR